MLTLVEAHTTMSLKRRQQRWDHDYEPLAAYAVGGLPERNQGTAHPFVPPRALPGLAFVCNLASSPSRQRPNRVLAMPTCRCTKLIENASLLGPSPRAVALRHRPQYLAPCAHADPPRHRRHRPDSVTQPQSSAGASPVTFSVRQCAPYRRAILTPCSDGVARAAGPEAVERSGTA